MVKEIKTNADFNHAISHHHNIIIDVYADWCGPCKMIKPAFEKLSEKYAGKVHFYKMNIDDMENEGIALPLPEGIPEFIFIHNRHEVGRVSGANIDRVEKTLISKFGN
jgi:thioredoxin 1